MGTPKEGEQALVSSLPGLVFDLVYAGKITLTSEDVESLCRFEPLHYTGKEYNLN